MTINQLIAEEARKRGISEEGIEGGRRWVDSLMPGERKKVADEELTPEKEFAMRMFIQLCFIMQDDPQYRRDMDCKYQQMVARN